MIRRTRRERGFVSAMVIAMFLLVSVAVVTMSVWFTTQAKRTQATVAGVQIRQLLMAAVPGAVEELKARGADDRTITLATPVEGASVVLTIAKKDDSQATVGVAAELRGKKGAQTVAFEKTGEGAWRVLDTRLLYCP